MYEEANELVAFSSDSAIKKDIEQSEFNDIILKNLSFQFWGVSKKDGVFYANVVVEQISMQSVYAFALKQAQQDGTISEEAWNSAVLNGLKSCTEKFRMQCSVETTLYNNKLCIVMTPELKNCIFGGELDAIRLYRAALSGK